MEERETPLAIFALWRTVTQHHNAQPERWMLKKIESAQARFTDQQIRDAIHGCTYSPYHNYAPPGQRRLTTLGVIFASDESLTRFAHLAETRRQQENQNQKSLQREAAPERRTTPARVSPPSTEAVRALDAIRHLLPRARSPLCE